MEMEMHFVDVTIKGISPLLMHRFTEEATIAVEDSPHKGRARFDRKTATPREIAQHHAYINEADGHLVLPIANLTAAIMDAGSFFKIGKKQVTTQKSSLVPAGLWLQGAYCDLGTSEFEVDSRRIVNANNNNPAISHRPRLDEWSCQFTLEHDISMFDDTLARALVDTAGKRIGVGSYRPQRRGTFGRFVVDKWERTALK